MQGGPVAEADNKNSAIWGIFPAKKQSKEGTQNNWKYLWFLWNLWKGNQIFSMFRSSFHIITSKPFTNVLATAFKLHMIKQIKQQTNLWETFILNFLQYLLINQAAATQGFAPAGATAASCRPPLFVIEFLEQALALSFTTADQINQEVSTRLKFSKSLCSFHT